MAIETNADLREALEKRDEQTKALRKERTSAMEMAEVSQEALRQMRNLIPSSVTPAARTGIAWSAGGLSGIANGIWPDMPKPIIPAAMTVVGVIGQFIDVSPDWTEAATGLTDGGGAVTAYLVTETASKGAIDWLKTAMK